MNSKWLVFNSETDGDHIIDMAMDIVDSSNIKMEMCRIMWEPAKDLVGFCGNKGAATVRYTYCTIFEADEIILSEYEDLKRYRPYRAEVTINKNMLRKTLKSLITLHTI